MKEGETNLNKPYFMICVDSRAALGGLIHSESIEICWVFPLTLEKFRIKTMAHLIEADDERV